ncbi:MAG: tetratricopeptide repeat protein [Bacteroidota bacterium]|jgi:tetratricopeptide (TPR) repeat protein|nr:tetratricopeptide repeat protein [Bacteroidota bacterium]
MAASTSTWVMVAGAGALVAGVLWMPRTPASAPKPPTAAEISVADIGTDPVDIAVAKVNGENPMEGILELRTLAEETPPNLDAVMWLGRFSVQSGQLDKARERFDQVIDAQPDRVEAYWERAMLDMEEGYLEDAVQGFDLCISADEMYVNGRFFKARCLEAMGQVDQALSEYKSYLPLSPDTAVSRSVEGIIERLESGLPGSGT